VKESKQSTIQDSTNRTKVWDANDLRAMSLTRKVREMVALDSEPFSVVKYPGFISVLKVAEPRFLIPSKRQVTEKVVPEIYFDVIASVKEVLAKVKWYSCTIHVWSTEVSKKASLA